MASLEQQLLLLKKPVLQGPCVRCPSESLLLVAPTPSCSSWEAVVGQAALDRVGFCSCFSILAVFLVSFGQAHRLRLAGQSQGRARAQVDYHQRWVVRLRQGKSIHEMPRWMHQDLRLAARLQADLVPYAGRGRHQDRQTCPRYS